MVLSSSFRWEAQYIIHATWQQEKRRPGKTTIPCTHVNHGIVAIVCNMWENKLLYRQETYLKGLQATHAATFTSHDYNKEGQVLHEHYDNWVWALSVDNVWRQLNRERAVIMVNVWVLSYLARMSSMSSTEIWASTARLASTMLLVIVYSILNFTRYSNISM